MAHSPGAPSAELAALTDRAFEELEAAVQADNEQKTAQALELYGRAMTTFRQVASLELVPQRRERVLAGMAEHSQRMAQLQETLGGKLFEAAVTVDEQGKKQEAYDSYVEALAHYMGALAVYRTLGPTCEGHVTELQKRVGGMLSHVEDLKASLKSPGGSPAHRTPAPTTPDAGSIDLSDLASLLPIAPSAPILASATSGGGGRISPPPSPPRPPTATVTASPPRASRSSLTPMEIEVLKRSSTINGHTFMPWLDGEETKERFTTDGDRPFTDPDGLLPLSPKQRSKLGGWKRPSEFVTGAPQMIVEVSPYTIEQELVTDCSFVASLCICAAFERRFGKRLIPRIIYPQDRSGNPVYNPAGKYMVKLWANGVARKVLVDDLFPVGRDNRMLCSCSKKQQELWVSVVEKAYMKLNGGYDFPGSNSGIDLFALTGWIPEQIHFEESDPAHKLSKATAARAAPLLDHRQPPERAWERLLSACQYGDCLITVATSAMAQDEADALGLVPTHAYAVLDVREVNGLRLLLVKNPWAHKRWTGSYSATDVGRWTSELRQAVKYDPDKARTKDDGIFWIDWPSIMRYFNTIFLNWNPSLFAHRSVTHATWPASQGPRNDSYNLGANPQFVLTIQRHAARPQSKPTVWLLLTRHVTSKEATLQAGDFLTMHVYKNGGKRVYYPADDAFVRGLYSNNPHNLVRFDVEDDDPGTYSVVLSQFDKTRDVSYTLNAYCTAPFAFAMAPPTPDKVDEIKGAWDVGTTAGGRLGLPTFMHNPQYSLAINRRCSVHLELLAPKDLYVAISLVGGVKGGRRVDVIAQGEEVLTSGAFRQGFSMAEGDTLEPGLYTIIVYTYEAGQKGDFVLKVHSTAPPQHIKLIPAEGEGMARQVISGFWSPVDGTAVGCITNYLCNPVYTLTCAQRSKLLIRLLCPEKEAINVTVFRTVEQRGFTSPYPGLPPNSGPVSEHAVATSNKGIFMASNPGVVTPAFDVEAGTYYIIVSTYDPRPATFNMIVYSFPKPVTVYRYGAAG